jgi:serine/threonine-protein kinase
VADTEDGETQASLTDLPAIRTRAAGERALSPTASPSIASALSTGTTAGASLDGTSMVASPLEALERDEILRTRRFCVISVGVALGAAAAMPFVGADPAAGRLMLGAIVVALVGIAFLWWRTRDPVVFRKPSTALGWFIPAVCVTTALPVFGVFSPAPVVLVLGVYFTGLGRSVRLAAAIYATCAGLQALNGGLVIAGMRDRGMVVADHLGFRDRVIVQLLVQLVLLATYITARMSRRTALRAFEELERAVRVSARREALLLEAREELERALRPGRGRFSGQTIAGHELGVLLGRGGMGEVYEAIGSRGTVAIKMLAHASLGDPNHVLRFLRELRTAAAIASPHVVRVLEVGEQPVPFLVMEKLEGKTLGAVLRERRGLAPADIVDMLRQVGAGVTAAAAAGVVHRDLKPQNLFRHGATWKILDFGVARALDSADTLTAGRVVGTPSYMAPEQAKNREVDHRSDLYALAAIAYRAFTGQPPFAAGEIVDTLYKVVHSAPRRPSELAEMPAQLDIALAIGLAKSPTARFQTADELVDAVASACAGTLSEELRRRGEELERAGAWRSAPTSAPA